MSTKFTKQEKSWITYDWANSVYATVMLAAIFPTYFTAVCGNEGDLWWSIGTSIATAFAAILAPFLGTIADYHGMKKKLLTTFIVLGVGFTGYCALVDSWKLMLVGYIISYVGFSGSCMIYDSMLVDVTTDDRMDRVSAWGFSMGYIGGSTIPFVLCILLITFGSSFGIDSTMAIKLSLLITVIWWAAFSLPILKHYEQTHGNEMPKAKMMSESFKTMLGTIREMASNKGILIFTVAYFFYIDGVNTIIKMSTAYGSALGLDTTGMILALLVTQLVAFPCAIWFGKLASRYGAIKLLTVAIGVYFFICILGFIMGFGLEEEFLSIGQATILFWTLAFLVGTVQGGIQALSRSHFGKMVPKEKSSEYFGVFDIFGKFAAVMGPAIYAVVKASTGRSSLAILAIIFLFFVGGVLMLAGKKHFNEAENAEIE